MSKVEQVRSGGGVMVVVLASVPGDNRTSLHYCHGTQPNHSLPCPCLSVIGYPSSAFLALYAVHLVLPGAILCLVSFSPSFQSFVLYELDSSL